LIKPEPLLLWAAAAAMMLGVLVESESESAPRRTGMDGKRIETVDRVAAMLEVVAQQLEALSAQLIAVATDAAVTVPDPIDVSQAIQDANQDATLRRYARRFDA